jgi:hypothetical protein
LHDGSKDSDNNYDFIVTDLEKTVREHESEDKRIEALIRSWQESPEAMAMAR